MSAMMWGAAGIIIHYLIKDNTFNWWGVVGMVVCIIGLIICLLIFLFNLKNHENS